MTISKHVDFSSHKDSPANIAVIPTGSYEYHGENLPYDTDSVIAEKIVSLCISRLNLGRVVGRNVKIHAYPVLKYGYSIEWISYPGTISLNPKTYLDLLDSIINSIEENIYPIGYIIVNAHGGNYSLLEVFAREKFYRIKKPFIIIDIWKTASRYGLKYCHACIFEQQLYAYLTNQCKQIEIQKEEQICYSRELTGYYDELKIGGCGNTNIDPRIFVNEICKLMGDAIKIIIDRYKNYS